MKGVMGLVLLKRIILLLLSASSCVTILGLYPKSKHIEQNFEFPYSIEGTGLILESICTDNYGQVEAIFHNSGTMIIESFYVEVITDNCSYCFESTMLPAGGRILICERDRKIYDRCCIQYINGYIKVIGLEINGTIDNRITISGNIMVIDNSSYNEINMLDLYLKRWDQDKELYLSDRTFKIVVRRLMCGDVVKIILPGDDYKIVYYKTAAP